MITKPVVCIGAALIDDSFFCKGEPIPGTSNPATFHRSPGGVARNIAHHLALLGDPVELVSHFGNDVDGLWLLEKCSSVGIRISHSRISETGTGRFTGIISPGGELLTGAVFTNFETEITPSLLAEKTSFLKSASLILFDCNLNYECLVWLLEFCRKHSIPSVIETVSVAKATRLVNVNLQSVLLITPNEAELKVLSGNPSGQNIKSSIEHLLKKGVQKIWVRKGKDGSELFKKDETIKLSAPVVNVVDSTGAGDAALAGWIHAWLQKKDEKECLVYGHAMAEIILQTKGANADHLNNDLLEMKVTHQSENELQ